MSKALDEWREIVSYDPDTGFLFGRTDGKRVESKHRKDYLLVRRNGKRALAHRLAWALFYGEWPAESIDHINQRGGDNRIANLRLATKAQNMRNRGATKNNRLGFKGVTKQFNRYHARIKDGTGKSRHLGCFATPEEAHAAYLAASKELHGEFACA